MHFLKRPRRWYRSLRRASRRAILTVDPFPKVLMTHRYIKIGATVTVLVLAFVGLMASLGTFLLLAAFVVCSYAAVVSVAGARRRSRRLIESGIGAFYLVAALMAVASAVIVNAFLTDDFSIKYVAHYSDTVQPLFYKITSYWGGLDGSIMFWVFLLSVFGSIAVYVNRERHRELIPYVVATISVVQTIFLFRLSVRQTSVS